MAKKQRTLPAQSPPFPSSSEAEMSSSSDEEPMKKTPIQNKKSESEEESSDNEEGKDEDENPQPVKKPTSNSSIRHPQKPPIQKQNSESEEESSDEEEAGDEDENPQPVKKPTPSKPEPKSEKMMLPPSKQPILDKSHGKSPIVRIWSINDEIAILQAMLDYQSKNGHIGFNTTVVKDLHDSIRKSLSINVDNQKFAEKIRRMKKKYMCARKKGAKLTFPQSHDKTMYDLSNKIWGKTEDNGFDVNDTSRGAMVNRGRSLKREFPFIRDALGANRLALEMLEMVDVKKVGTLEEKFKKLKTAELNVTCELYKLLLK